MRHRPKSMRSMLLAVAVLAVVLLGARWMGLATTRSALRVGCIESGGWDRWSARYVSLHGMMERTIHPDGTLNIAVETEEGVLSMTIRDQDGGVIFRQDDMGTEEHSVAASGRVTVRVEADHHKGSFSVGP